jgi:hypothetical protein
MLAPGAHAAVAARVQSFEQRISALEERLDRIEPRACKRRVKEFDRLDNPRNE